jgi:hypothetical protein
MFANIIIFLIFFVILAIILHYSKGYKEEFFDFPDAEHNVYVQNSKDKYNELTTTINLLDPAIPINPDTNTAFKIALGGITTKPTSTSYNLSSTTNYGIPNNIPNTFQQAQSCEAAGTTCSAFDDNTFAANCGMSFDIKGIDASGKPHIGGLFISPTDRQQQMDRATNVLSTGSAPYDPYKVYQPTLGKSKPGTFSLTKDQCLIVKEKVDCAAKQTFNSPNCTQCYTSQNFARVGPETGRIPSVLYLFGSGNVTVSSQNNTIVLPINNLDATNPMTVAIPADAEGTVFSIIAQQPNNNPLPYIAGFIQGETPRGTFKLDLFNLVESDQVSKAKPKINGSITVGGFRCLTMVPGTGQTYINLACIIPFSFLSMYDGDALTCDNGPIITQAASATFLESDPCFGKANQPGNYKLECLQTRWVELGGTSQGTGYPANKTAADAIQKDANGNPLDIDTIVNNLAPKMTAAVTGQDATGKNLSIENWNTVSMFATGTPINTPCDGPSKDNGPLSQECLSYLYQNQGINSHIGPTYTLMPSVMASMIGQNTPNTYCQPGAGIDPSTPAGLKFAQSLGGINAVKQSYDQINRLANDNSQSNQARAQAVQQCYGVTIDPMNNPKTPGPTQVFAVGPGYNYTQGQAQQICSQYGAQVATTAQLQDAQTKGADWCFSAWVSDSNNPMYPITTSTEGGCGNGGTGIMSWNPGGVAGVNCYGPKPGIDDYPLNTILPFNRSSWDYNSNTLASVGGLMVWYDGSDPNGDGTTPADGSSVNTWVNKAGYSQYNAVAITPAKYVAAQKALFFDGSPIYSTQYPADPTSETIFIVFNTNPSNKLRRSALLSGYTGARGVWTGYTDGSGGAGSVGILSADIQWNATTPAGSYVYGSTALATGQISGGSSNISLNAGTVYSGPTNFTKGTTTYIGMQRGSNPSNPYVYEGTAMEILIYNTVLSTANIQRVQQFLAGKWGFKL